MNEPRHSPLRLADVLRILNRLTQRDLTLVDLLGDHRVLTTHQIARALFPTEGRARARLADLHRSDVIARFRPPRLLGSAPYHYTLGYTGACIHAAAHDRPWPRRALHAERTTRIATSPVLGHTLGVADFFTHLMAHARGVGWDVRWCNEGVAADIAGGLIRPDALGEVAIGEHRVQFYYEHDAGTEDRGRLAAKLARYGGLATQLPVLIEFTTPDREAGLHQLLAKQSYSFPVATTYLALTNRLQEPIWWRLHGVGRLELLALAQC